MAANASADNAAHVSTVVKPPNGLGEIRATFGDIYRYVGADGTLDLQWHTEYVTRLVVPFPMVLCWDHSTQVSKIACHKKMADVFSHVFEQVRANGLEARVRSFGGCFAFRPKRTGNKLSTHCWGIAIDLNPETNGLGTEGDMDPAVVEIFRQAGFKWGGDWEASGRDPMHFQYCTGY